MASEEDVGRLREGIWDLIYENGHQPPQQLAEQLNVDVETVTRAVEHEWFEVTDGNVCIANSGSE